MSNYWFAKKNLPAVPRFDAENSNVRAWEWTATFKEHNRFDRNGENHETVRPNARVLLNHVKNNQRYTLEEGGGQNEIGEQGRAHAHLYLRFQPSAGSSGPPSAPAIKSMLEDVTGFTGHVFIQPKRSFSSERMKAYVVKSETREEGTVPVWYSLGADRAAVEELDEEQVRALQSAGQAPSSSGVQGAERRDSERAVLLKKVASGEMTLTEVMEQNPYQYGQWKRLFHDTRAAYCNSLPSVREEKIVAALWGQTGFNKTRSVDAFLDLHGLTRKDAFWVKSSANERVWFDNYDGHSVLVFDDFEGKIAVQDFLHITDFNAGTHLFEVKFGKVRLMHRMVIFTSNSHPQRWYDGEEWPKQQAVARRITFRKCFTRKWAPQRVAFEMTASIMRQDPKIAAALGLKKVEALELDKHELEVEAHGNKPFATRSWLADDTVYEEYDHCGHRYQQKELPNGNWELTVGETLEQRKQREMEERIRAVSGDEHEEDGVDDEVVESAPMLARTVPPSVKVERMHALEVARAAQRAAMSGLSRVPTKPVPFVDLTETESDSEDEDDSEVSDATVPVKRFRRM